MFMQNIKKFFSRGRNKAIALLLVVLLGVSAISVAIYQDHQKLMGTHIKVGKYDVSTLEYNFYQKSYEDSFISKYSEYLESLGINTSEDYGNQQCLEYDMTWNEYFEGRTLEFIQEIYILYDDALKNNFKIDTETLYDDFIQKCSAAAQKEDLTLNEYLSGYYSSGATEKNFKEIYEKYITAIKYREEKKESLEPENKEIEEFYKDNRNGLDVVTYRNFIIKADCSDEDTQEDIASAMEEAKTKAEEMFSQIYDQKTYVELCKEYSENKEIKFEEETLNENISYNDCSDALVSWLFDLEREENATAIIEDTTNMEYNIVYFISRDKNKTKTVNFKHILIAPETDEQNNVVEGALETAESQADEVYKEWNSSDKKSSTFDSFVKKYSSDTETANNGGLYEEIAEGILPDEMDKWLFEEGRKEGDTELIKTESGYHIVYYLEEGDEEWIVLSRNQMVEDRYREFVEKQIKKFPITDVKGQINYLKLSTPDQAVSTKDSV